MKIKSLDILSYGKFNDFKIEFRPGFNLIYGSNESGKSTMVSFIMAMLYGGTLPGSKIARYTKEYEAYIPWRDSRYEGAMEFSCGDETYHLYRNLEKGREELSIKNIYTGVESKHLFNIDQSRKVEVFDQRFFGITETNFRNTFLIDSSEDKVASTGTDIRDRLLNQLETNIETLSTSNIIDRIDREYLNNTLINNIRGLNNSIKDKKTQLKYMDIGSDYNSLIRELENINVNIKKKGYEIEDEKQSTIGRNIIKNPEYIKSIIYQKETLSTKIEDMEEELAQYKSREKKLLWLRPVTVFLAMVVIIAGIYFKKYYLVLSVILIGLVETYRGTLETKIRNIEKTLRDTYFSLDNILEKISKYDSDTSDNLNPNLSRLEEDLKDLEYSRERVLERIRIEDENKKRGRNLKEEIQSLENNREELEFKKDMAETAKDIIENLSKDRVKDVSKRVLEISSSNISFLTDGKYSQLLVSQDGEITLYNEEIGRYVTLENVSRGTYDQVYFSYRLALIANLSIEFPVIIDDGFAFYDEVRKDRALKLMEKFGERYQVFYFTSSERDLEYLIKNKNNNIIYI